jgi:hypothetical protein
MKPKNFALLVSIIIVLIVILCCFCSCTKEASLDTLSSQKQVSDSTLNIQPQFSPSDTNSIYIRIESLGLDNQLTLSPVLKGNADY